MSKSEHNFVFTLKLSILLYIFLFLSTNVLYLREEIGMNISRFVLISVIDLILNICITFLLTSFNKIVIYIYSVFISLIGFINYWTVSITNKRFALNDIFLAKAAMNNLTEIHIKFLQIVYFIVLILLSTLICYFIHKYDYKKMSIKATIFRIVFSFGLIVYVIFQLRSSSFLSYQIKNSKYLYSETVYMVESFNYLKQPDNYNENLKIIKEKENKKIETTKNGSPIIIQVMSEALADFDNVEYMPYTRTIESGRVKTNIWGNKTVVSELESLTGISTDVLKTDGTNIYNSRLNTNMDSTISILKKNGYKTVGIHPYTSTSYDRGSKWETLGFDEVEFFDSFKNSTYVRDYISDQSFFNQILKTVNENQDTPLYIYGITIQNHAGFNDENFKNTEKLGSQELSQYLSLQNITDNAFKDFVEELKKQDREVILLYYGDHQPMLGDSDYKILNVKDKYEVPYVLWSNKRKLDTPKNTRMCYLPTLLLKSANIPLDSWFDNLDKLSNNDSDLTTDKLYSSWCYYQLKK